MKCEKRVYSGGRGDMMGHGCSYDAVEGSKFCKRHTSKAGAPFTVYAVSKYLQVIESREYCGETAEFWIDKNGRRDKKFQEFGSLWFRSRAEALASATEHATVELGRKRKKIEEIEKRMEWLHKEGIKCSS